VFFEVLVNHRLTAEGRADYPSEILNDRGATIDVVDAIKT